VALIPVTEGALTVFFKTSSPLDISRAMALQKDLGFKLILSETQRADKMVDAIKERKFPVMVSLELPEDKSEKKPSGRDDASAEKSDSSSVEKPGEVDPEKKALEQRRQESLEEHYRQAATLSKANVAFGFSTLGVKSKDIFPNLRKMIEHGLDEDQALAALTVNPAKLLQLESLIGTVEPGKLANLVITTGPLFEEKTQVRYVIVDGQLHEFEIKPPKSKKSDKTASVKAAGTWKYSVDIPGDQTHTGKIVITESAGGLTGYFVNDDDGVSRDLSDISLTGQELKFKSQIEADGAIITVDFFVEISGDAFAGEVVLGSLGAFEINGDRAPE
jgi:hypothetical protein